METEEVGLASTFVRIDLGSGKEVTYGFFVRREIHSVRSEVR